MDNPVLAAISDRRSIRSYTGQKLSKEQFDILLRAAEQAPSARNSQPWHFTVTQNRKLLDEINAEVSKVLEKDVGDLFHGAPGAVFISYDPENRFAPVDCGIASQTIALAAHAIGLGTVILGMPDPAFTGPRKEYFSGLFKFPPGYRFAVALAVGVPAGAKEAHPVERDRISFVD
ncbi:MAG: nitroreductase family protein [Treponema sp.]|jgi:nitroreductase|nr:nitroreductase family protein [Treponema sp.]